MSRKIPFDCFIPITRLLSAIVINYAFASVCYTNAMNKSELEKQTWEKIGDGGEQLVWINYYFLIYQNNKNAKIYIRYISCYKYV